MKHGLGFVEPVPLTQYHQKTDTQIVIRAEVRDV